MKTEIYFGSSHFGPFGLKRIFLEYKPLSLSNISRSIFLFKISEKANAQILRKSG